MTNQLTVRIDAKNGIAVVSGSAIAGQGEITIQDNVARGAAHRSWGLALAAATGCQVLAFPAAAQRLSATCKECTDECGTPIFYPEDGSCPNPIFYPESMIAIGGALVVGVAVGALVCFKRRNSGSGTQV